MGGGGFEPPKAAPTDLQSAPFDRSGIPPWYPSGDKMMISINDSKNILYISSSPFDPKLRADGRIRTADQLITNQLLYQLSYIGNHFLFWKGLQKYEQKDYETRIFLNYTHKKSFFLNKFCTELQNHYQ